MEPPRLYARQKSRDAGEPGDPVPIRPGAVTSNRIAA
jgi:hypothetical protein